MKRFVCILLALMLAFAVCAEEIGEEITEIEEEELETATMYTVGDHDITVYAEADLESEKVGVVLSRMPVTVIEPDLEAEFQHISWTMLGEEHEGYVRTRKLCRFETMELCVYAYVMGENGLYLRTEPNGKAEAITLMPCGTRVIVNRYHSQWASVTVTIMGKQVDGYCFCGPDRIGLKEETGIPITK